jgi:hypothetical protein
LLDEAEAIVDATGVAHERQPTGLQRLTLAPFLIADFFAVRDALAPNAAELCPRKDFGLIRPWICLAHVRSERAVVLRLVGAVIEIVVAVGIISELWVVLEGLQIKWGARFPSANQSCAKEKTR